MRLYPASLAVAGRRCVVVGGGAVAERKVAGLLDADAAVVVVSPALTAQLADWAASGHLAHLARPYAAGDLAGAWLAVAATDRRAVNAAVATEAEALGILVNIADDPAASTLHTVAAVRRGDLVLTAATGGGSPALAALVRRKLDAAFGPEYAALAALLAAARARYAHLPPAARAALGRVLATDELLELLRAGDHAAAERHVAALAALQSTDE